VSRGSESESDDYVVLTYSAGSKAWMLASVAIALGGVVLFTYCAVTFASEKPTLALMFGCAGVWFSYGAYLRIRLCRFLNVCVRLTDDSLEVQRGSERRRLAWSEIGLVRHDGFNQVLSVRDRADEQFLLLDTWHTAFSGLDEVFKNAEDSRV
jgi:hypothetical protein